MKKNITLFFSILLLTTGISYAQVGINTQQPKASLDITRDSISSDPQGVLIPRMTLSQLNGLSLEYGFDQHGIMIQITDINPTIDPTDPNTPINNSTSKITIPGYYTYNATLGEWQIKNTESWKSVQTGEPAIQNDIDIFKEGRVSIGSSELEYSAKLDIYSANGGLLIPRHTTNSRNKIEESSNGLLIYNVTTNCFNYYDQVTEKWLSLCGDPDPADISISSCNTNDGVGPNVTINNEGIDYHLQQGTALTYNNTYTLQVLVATTGPYNIRLESDNGYSYIALGEFNNIGLQTIILEGQGTPIEPSSPDGDTLKLYINEKEVTPDCTLPSVKVLKADTAFKIDSHTLYLDDYYIGVPGNTNNFITINLTPGQRNPGNIVLSTQTTNEDPINGVHFSSNSTEINANTTEIKIYLRGVAERIGTYNYSFTYPEYGNSNTSAVYNFTVEFKSNYGSYEQPVRSCLYLKDKGMTEDGYYWLTPDYQNGIINENTPRYKTYCDLVGGGWTLVRSTSEKNYIGKDYISLVDQQQKNEVTSRDGKFNEYEFALAAEKLKKLASGSDEYKIVIKEKGHTTNQAALHVDIENSTISINNDQWSQENYWEIKTKTSKSPLINGLGIYHDSTEIISSKVFGKELRKNPYDYTHFYDGSVGVTLGGGFFNTDWYFGHGNGGSGVFPSKVIIYDYPENSHYYGKSFKFNANQIRDLFGNYFADQQVNHHFLACTVGENSSNSDEYDYAGPERCSSAWSNWRPHRINEIQDSNGNGTGEYHGRIQQVWIK